MPPTNAHHEDAKVRANQRRLGRGFIAFMMVITVVWGLIFYVGVVCPLNLDVDYSKDQGQQENPKLGDLKIYGKDKKSYVYLERKEAIKYSFDQIDTSINYLFVAATAILGLVIKLLIEPQLDPKLEPERRGKLITPQIKILLSQVTFGCFLSLFCGFFARLFFTDIGDSAAFSIHDEVRLFAVGQVLAFFFAAILMVATAFLIMRSSK